MFDASRSGTGPEASVLSAALGSAEDGLTRAEAAPLVGLSARELVDAVGRLERLTTRVQLMSARVLAAVPIEPATVFDPFADTTADPALVSPQELGLVLKVSADSVRNRLFLAGTVINELPSVSAAAAEGCLKWWQVREAAEAITGLDPAAVAMVDERLAVAARGGRCRARFAATLRRIVIAAAPETAEQRHVEGLADRRIWFKPVGDGMSAFGGLLPAEDAVSLAACLTRLAGTPIAAPPVTCDRDGRTLGQARVDGLRGLAGRLLDELLDPPSAAARPERALAGGLAAIADVRRTAVTSAPGQPDVSARASRRAGRRAWRRGFREEERLTAALARMTAAGLLAESALSPEAPSRPDGGSGPRSRRGRPTGEIRVTVSAETLLGISQAPGDLDGSGPITAAHARRLAQRPGTTWRRLLTDPTSGTVLDIGRTRYRPPEALAELVKTRYGGRCTRPGCPCKVRDLDHIQPWQAGVTTTDRNLHLVCRDCHTARHRGWDITLHDDHTVTWTDPHGHTATTHPTDHRPEDHYPPTPTPARVRSTDDPWNADPHDTPPF